jgi:Coenzyme F420-dependent N5,N10-methylene tetrahydromethanopterin reductase and related flavin-dependent oxidoreductases
MQYAVTLSYEEEPQDVLALACEAEQAGWDAVFVWDGIAYNDAWVTLAAIAARTTRIKLGPMLTPISRRRPWKLAQEVATLDRLSGGRVILPVGLGAPETGFAKFGEETDRRVRAELLDEGLAILDGLWSGEPFSFQGKHYKLENVQFAPKPIQQPRVPIWVVGAWPYMKSMRRALRCDGILPYRTDRTIEPSDMPEISEFLATQRALDGYAIVMEGSTPGDDPQEAARLVKAWADGGINWWIENVWDGPRAQGGIEGMRQRILQGPPRID